MKRIILGMLLVVGMLLGKDLSITHTDLKTAEMICLDKDGVKQVEVGGYVTCGDGKVYDESTLILIDNKNEVNNIIVSNDGYHYICDGSNILRGIDTSYGDTYRVTWFNPKTEKEENLNCNDFELYKSIYIVNEED